MIELYKKVIKRTSEMGSTYFVYVPKMVQILDVITNRCLK